MPDPSQYASFYNDDAGYPVDDPRDEPEEETMDNADGGRIVSPLGAHLERRARRLSEAEHRCARERRAVLAALTHLRLGEPDAVVRARLEASGVNLNGAGA